MRFLFNDWSSFELALTLVCSAIHLGAQGSNDKEKMRSTLKGLMVNFLNFTDKEFTFIKRDGNIIGDYAWEDTQVDEFTSRDYYDMKINHNYHYSLNRY
jgi:hypothetical protein